MKIFTFLILGICLMSNSVMAQIVIEAESAASLSGSIQVDGSATALGSIKALVKGETTYDSTATWAEFPDVEIPVTGNYNFVTSTSGFQATALVYISIDGVYKGAIAAPSTGGWGVYKDSEPLVIALTSGKHLVRLGFGSSTSSTGFLMNIDKVTIAPAGLVGLRNFTNNDVNVFVDLKSKMVNIKSEKIQSANISLYNLAGTLIQSKTMSDGKITIDANGFERGIYLIRIESNGKTFSRKFVM